MFKDVQQLKIQECSEVIKQIENEIWEMGSEVRSLQDKLSDLQTQEQRGMTSYRGKKNFSFFEKFITARKAYHNYQQKIKELAVLPDKIAKLASELEIVKLQTADKIAQAGLEKSLNQAEDDLYNVEKALTLSELNVSVLDAMKFLEDNNIAPVLDSSDYEIFNRDCDYQSTKDLIAVHKMDVMPTGSRLSTVGEAGIKATEKIVLDGKEYEYNYLLERNTVHVSMNDEVSSHLGGNWENCHYTVLQPFAEIPKEQVSSMVPNDTYTRGGFDLTSNAWILCPVDEVDTVKELNQGVHVVGYQAENAKGLAAPFLSQLGYRAESVGQWGWGNEETQKKFLDLAQQEQINTVQHCDSTDKEDEEFNIATNKTIAIIKMLVKENLVQSYADLERLKPQLEQNAFYATTCHILQSTNVLDMKLINEKAIVANNRQVDVLSEKMQKAGIPLTNHEQEALQAQVEDYHSENATELRHGLNLQDMVSKIMLNSTLRAREM
ncbi:MAG: hypothetical protein MJ054_01865, partial [Clostridia bacterium]|nr:hypothetical protein [Clostridia bacterium]